MKGRLKRGNVYDTTKPPQIQYFTKDDIDEILKLFDKIKIVKK